jgi:hypothetical protein
MPKGLRSWELEPLSQIYKKFEAKGNGTQHCSQYNDLWSFYVHLEHFYKYW